MTPDVIKQLEKQEPTEFHSKLLSYCKRLVKPSRADMAKRYADWDTNQLTYEGKRMPDEEDVDMAREGKPVKMVMPNNYAQTMTFTSFLFLMFKQNRNFFELEAGPDIRDMGTKKSDREYILNHDWRRNYGSQLLFQNLRDTAVFGLAPLEVCWTKELSRVYVNPAAPVMQVSNNIEVTSRAGSGWEEFVKYEGNLVRSISPYRFFPDTAFPLSEFHKSKSFCAWEKDFTLQDLKDMEKSGEVAGISHIEALPQDLRKLRGAETRLSFDTKTARFDQDKPESPVVVTMCQVWIVPDTFTFGPNDKRLGPETFPVLYHVWYANDHRIIRAEPAYAWHNEYGVGVSQFTPDMHESLCGLSLCGLIYYLQDVISWMINSRITNVRRAIQNRNVVNPAFVEPKSYDGEGDIYIRKGIGRVDPRMAVMQLNVSDVTAGHLQDADILGKLMQMVSGVNDNAMGQYNSGRRSASEARVVTAGAAGRMKMHGHLIWEQCLGRIGRLMLSNSCQSLSLESFTDTVGYDGKTDPAQRHLLFQGTPKEIVRGADYLIFDSTLSSEKAFMAQNLQELLQIIFQANPLAAQQFALKIDPTKVFDELQYLRDGSPASAFYYEPGAGPQLPAPQAVPAPAAQPAYSA